MVWNKGTFSVPLFPNTYDSASQRIREDNTFLNETYVYEYDKAGNPVERDKGTVLVSPCPW